MSKVAPEDDAVDPLVWTVRVVSCSISQAALSRAQL